MRRFILMSGILMLLASVTFGQITGGRVAGPLMNAVGQGTIMGYVYWDGNAVKHTPANDCSGLSVTVSAGGAALGTFSTGHFASIPNSGTFSVCAYTVNQMPVGQNLQVQVNVTAPAVFSPAVAVSGTSAINIMGGTAPCNNLPPAVPSATDLSRNWWTCPNYAYNVNFILSAATGLVGANRMAVSKVPPGGVPQTANSGGQATLLTPGGQKTLLGAQANSTTGGVNSAAPVPQQTASAGASLSGGAQASGTLGPSQTMSATGPSPAAGPLTQPNNLTAPGTTPSNNSHGLNSNAVLTVCMEKAMQGQASWTAISAVDGKAVGQVPGGGGSAPGFPILVGGFTSAIVTFHPGNHYTIQGCGFGSTTGQVFLQGTNLHVTLYPQQWSDQRIDAQVDPSASEGAQMVVLVVQTAGTTKGPLPWGGSVGQATAFALGFDPNGSAQANMINGNTASAGNSANSVNRLAATQLGPAQTASSPQTTAAGPTMSATGSSAGSQANSPASGGNSGAPVAQQTAFSSGSLSGGAQAGSNRLGPSQTMSATGSSAGSQTPLLRGGASTPAPSAPNSPRTLGGAFSAAVISSGAQVALSCANDPRFRIIGVSGTPDGVTLEPGPLYTIWGCAFGDVSNPKAPTRPNSLAGQGAVPQAGQGPGEASISWKVGTGFFLFPETADFEIKSWTDNAIVASLPFPRPWDAFPEGPLTIGVTRTDSQHASKDGFGYKNGVQGVAPPADPKCSQDSTFRVLNTSPATTYLGNPTLFPNTMCIFSGCSFGASTGTLFLIDLEGANNDPVKFYPTFWNDNFIVGSFDKGYPYASSYRLVLQRNDGKQITLNVAFQTF